VFDLRWQALQLSSGNWSGCSLVGCCCLWCQLYRWHVCFFGFVLGGGGDSFRIQTFVTVVTVITIMVITFHSLPPHNILNWPCFYQLQETGCDFVWPQCCNIKYFIKICSVVISLKHEIEETDVSSSKYSYTVWIEI
jgi:hypothetical protein